MNARIQDLVNKMSLAIDHFIRNVAPVQQQSGKSTRHVHFCSSLLCVKYLKLISDLASTARPYSGYHNSTGTPEMTQTTIHPDPKINAQLPVHQIAPPAQLQYHSRQSAVLLFNRDRNPGASIITGLLQGLWSVLGNSNSNKVLNYVFSLTFCCEKLDKSRPDTSSK